MVVVVVGLQVHNHATTWPNLQDGTCKNSIQFEFQVGPECGNDEEVWPLTLLPVEPTGTPTAHANTLGKWVLLRMKNASRINSSWPNITEKSVNKKPVFINHGTVWSRLKL